MFKESIKINLFCEAEIAIFGVVFLTIRQIPSYLSLPFALEHNHFLLFLLLVGG